MSIATRSLAGGASTGYSVMAAHLWVHETAPPSKSTFV